MAEKDDLKLLLNAVLPFARPLVEQFGEFHPFAAFVDCGGIVQILSADASTEFPSSSEVARVLTEALREKAKRGECRAVALCYEGRNTRSGEAATDAIVVHLEREGLYMEAALPFVRAPTGVTYGNVGFSKVVPKIEFWRRLQ